MSSPPMSMPAVISSPPGAAWTAPIPVVPVPPPVVPASGRHATFARDATRYMCCAVYLDSWLNRQVLDGVLFQEFRATASSPGVDLATVLRHALAARRRQRVTDVLLMIFLPFWILSGLGFFAAWIAVTVERLQMSYGVLAPHLRRGTFDPAAAPQPPSPRIRRALDEIADRDRGNVTVYPGYSPFVGFGQAVKDWSFVADVSRAAPGETVRSFDIRSLHDHVAAEVAALALPGVTVDDRLFVAGDDLLNGSTASVTPHVLPDPVAAPRQQADEALIRHLWDKPEDRSRPYLALRVTGWGGELVMTVFLRFVKLRDELLYVEAEYLLLPPLKHRYRTVDDLHDRPSGRQVARIIGGALPAAIIRSVLAPFMVIEMIGGPARTWFTRRRERREILQDRTFNYGAVIAPREAAADGRYHRRFQAADGTQYLKIIERRVLDAVETFLRAHGVDPSDVRERQTTILNAGVMMSGNAQLHADSVAVGAGARATTFVTRAAMAATGRKG